MMCCLDDKFTCTDFDGIVEPDHDVGSLCFNTFSSAATAAVC